MECMYICVLSLLSDSKFYNQPQGSIECIYVCVLSLLSDSKFYNHAQRPARLCCDIYFCLRFCRGTEACLMSSCASNVH